MKEFITVCPRNCYSTCTFRVQVEGNRIKRILPDKQNRAAPEGPCIKGLSYIERSSSSQRITKPLYRNKSGRFVEISKGDAVGMIAEKLSRYVIDPGPKSVLYYTGSGMSGLTNEIGYNFFNLFGGATTTYGNFCWPAGLEAVRLTLGEIKHNVTWDIENANLVIAWGKNPAETNIQEMSFINRAIENGADFIVIDPRRTKSGDKATLVIRPKPGTDAALALAIARILIDEGKIDKQFIGKYVVGFDNFAQAISIGPDEAESITGIPSEKITELAHRIGSADSMTILAGYGLQRFTNGGQTIRSILALSVITGNIGRPGASFNYANLQGYIFDHLKEPLSYYPDINQNPKFRRKISIARLGEDMLSLKDPVLKMAIVERGNPLTQAPDTNRVKEAFGSLVFTVVIDQFMTDTARIADLVIPAKNMFEQQDIVSSYWSPYISYRPRIVDPPEDVMTECELFNALGKKLSLDFSESDIPDPDEVSIDRWLESRIGRSTGVTLDLLKKEKLIAPGLQEIAYSDYKFNTPTKRIELFSESASKKWGAQKLPSYIPLSKYPDETDYPFHFMSPNTRFRIHSQFGNMDVIKEHDPEPLLQVSIEDASSLGIESGDIVEVSNRNGRIELKADVTSRILKGCVALPNGWWISEGGGSNFLSRGLETDMGYGTAFHNTMVNIKKA